MDTVTYERFRSQLVDAIWSLLDPLEDEIESTEKLPHSKLMPILRDLKVFGLLVPEQYGGVGLSIGQYVPILAEFAKIQGGIRVLMHVHNTVAHAVAALGTLAQKARLLPKVATGEYSIAFGLTEPEHGTGADIGTTAIRDQDDYVINGKKWLITNSDIASHFLVFAKTDPSAGAAGVSTIIVERNTPGFDIAPLPETMGCKGGQHGQLTFTNARAPIQNVLGSEGQGLAQMAEALEISRVLIAATSLGTAERALELSLAFAKQRVTFGKQIAARQAVQGYLADMATEIYAMRMMISDAAAKWDRGMRIPAEASMCKLFGLRAVGKVTDLALLVHGGIGYTRKHRIERLYRDARLNWLEEGTPTIQQMVIAHEFLSGFRWEDARSGVDGNVSPDANMKATRV